MKSKVYYRSNRRARSVFSNCCPTCGRSAEVPGQIFLQESTLTVTRGDVTVPLYRTEFGIVRALLDAYPRPVERDDLIQAGWGDHPPIGCTYDAPNKPFNNLYVCLCKLRKVLPKVGLQLPYPIRAANGQYQSLYSIIIEEWDLPSASLRQVS